MNNSLRPPAHSRLPLVLLTLICLAYSAWVLALPLFPTQDGPMHLYFTHVLQTLLFHPDSVYGQFYFVRHLLPPYALYYYLLMLLSSIVPLLLADKLIVCLYIFLFGFGFRYLARAIGPGGETAALLSTLLLLNWPLGMGFINFCLSTALALWALGLWCRFSTQPFRSTGSSSGTALGQRIGFVVLCYVILLTHPVPLLAVLGFCGFELLVRLLRLKAPRLLLADAIALLAATATLAYVRLFTASSLTAQVHQTSEAASAVRVRSLTSFAFLHWITAFTGRSLVDILYRGMFYALLTGAFLVLAAQYLRARRAGRWSLAETWTLVAIFFAFGLPFLPSDLNHSAYFAERLMLYVWIAALVAASGSSPSSRPVRGALYTFAVAGAALTLGLAQSRIHPIAQQVAAIEAMPPIPAHSVGLLMHDAGYHPPPTLTYDPFSWSGVRMLRRTDSILWNTPWLDLAIIPLGPRATMPTAHIPPHELESPEQLRKAMLASPALQSKVLAPIDVALFSFGQEKSSGVEDPLLRPAAGPAKPWICTPEQNYELCTTIR